MPLYEYVCTDCDDKFELIRPLSLSAEGATCPKCEGSAERVLSRFACFSTDESGVPTSVGGSACSSCSASSCSSCSI